MHIICTVIHIIRTVQQVELSKCDSISIMRCGRHSLLLRHVYEYQAQVRVYMGQRTQVWAIKGRFEYNVQSGSWFSVMGEVSSMIK